MTAIVIVLEEILNITDQEIDKYKRVDIREEKRSGHHHKDISWRGSKELDDPKYTRFEKGKSYDQEIRGLKDRHFKEPRERLDDKSALPIKKSKFSMDKDTEYSKDANEVQSSSSNQGQDFVGKATEQDFEKDSDVDAAKIAAMKAAELVTFREETWRAEARSNFNCLFLTCFCAFDCYPSYEERINFNWLLAISLDVGNEDIIYVSSENEVKVFDAHMLASWKPLDIYNYNKEEINQITCNSKSSFLAAADDGGDIKIIDIRQKCLYKTLRAAHESICSSVQFLPWRPWEVITGGLDSKLIMWDFSKGRPFKVMDLGNSDPDSSSSAAQCFNPAFVHAIAVPEADMLDKVDKICVVARGDGVVDVINIESEFKAAKSQVSSKPRKGGQSRSNGSVQSPNSENQNQRSRLRLDYSSGGHTAAVSCVAFSMFGEKGKYILSGSNDKSVKAWNWSRFFEADQTCDNGDFLHLNINLSRKVNWICNTSTHSENLVLQHLSEELHEKQRKEMSMQEELEMLKGMLRS